MLIVGLHAANLVGILTAEAMSAGSGLLFSGHVKTR